VTVGTFSADFRTMISLQARSPALVTHNGIFERTGVSRSGYGRVRQAHSTNRGARLRDNCEALGGTVVQRILKKLQLAPGA
jgi:hypothetical protein